MSLNKQVKDTFGGTQYNATEANEFEHYLYELVNVCFNLFPNEPITSDNYQSNLKAFSRYLANTNLIECRTADGRAFRRHLTKNEYERVSYDRVQRATGALLPYNEVKNFIEVVIPEADTTKLVDELTESWKEF